MKTTQRKNSAAKSAIVVGGGIVGLASAYALGLEGVRVRVIDHGPAEQRASSATAGIIGGSSVIPWASSALWPRLPAHLLDRRGPLRLALPWPPKLAGFFLKSVFAGRVAPRRQSSTGLANLGLRGWDAWQSLLSDLPEVRDLFRQNGCLFFYATPDQQRADAASNAIRRSFGMDLSDLDEADVKAILPPLSGPTSGAVRVNTAGHVSDPLGLQDSLRATVVAQGGAFISQSVIGLSMTGNLVTSVTTADGVSHQADTVVLCAGAGSRKLAARLGHSVPMIPAWGASVTFTNPSIHLTTPLLLLNDGIAMTPSKIGLRVSGLLQVGGAGRADAMVATLTEKARQMFGNFTYSDIQTYAGARPLMADSLPFLGADHSAENVFHNFGHGHWGLTQASISAQVISDVVMGRPPRIDISAYSPARF